MAAQVCDAPADSSELLDKVGLSGRKDNFPSQLSGGEQQRVAIARALVKRPKLLLCDEPTGALDSSTGRNILELLQKTCREEGMTVVLITHNAAITPIGDRVIRMKNGKAVEVDGGILGGLKDILFGSTGPRGGKRDGVVQSVAKSAARQVTNQIIRGMLGSLMGGRKR